jgi:hypothetical protein
MSPAPPRIQPLPLPDDRLKTQAPSATPPDICPANTGTPEVCVNYDDSDASFEVTRICGPCRPAYTVATGAAAR